MRSAVTVSLVPEARGGPFVFHDDLPAACRTARALGFDAVEVFPPGPEALHVAATRALLDDHGLSLAAVGTGAGWLRDRLTLTDPDASGRGRAVAFIRSIIDRAGPLGAPAIVGSMQGRVGPGASRPDTLGWLSDALVGLGRHAASHGVPLLYEPLNRYETNLIQTIGAGSDLLDGLGPDANVALLADLFHMNIEERNTPEAIRRGGPRIGHVHFVDSNRSAAGLGQLDFGPIVAALRAIGYAGYLSAEAFPEPDPEAAARATIAAFRRLVREGSGR